MEPCDFLVFELLLRLLRRRKDPLLIGPEYYFIDLQLLRGDSLLRSDKRRLAGQMMSWAGSVRPKPLIYAMVRSTFLRKSFSTYEQLDRLPSEFPQF